MKPYKTTTILTLSLSLVVSGCSNKQEGGHADTKYVPKVNCVNNLELIGIAFKMWARDHQQKFPFQMSTNTGGTLELVSPDQEGFDRNAFLYLKTMNGEEGLTTPRLLICPQDKSKKVAASWTNLRPENISYRFISDTNVGPFSSRLFAVCPIDGNVLYGDGTVLDKNGKPLNKIGGSTLPLFKRQDAK